MENLILSGENLKSKIYWGVMLAVSIFALGLAIFGLSEFSAQQFLILVVALVVTGFVNHYQFKIPKTPVLFSPREIIVFWGIIWLGIPGTVLLAASAAAARLRVEKKNSFQLSFNLFSTTTASFAAASFFYFFLHQTVGLGGGSVAESAIGWGWLVGGIGAAAIIHNLLSAVFHSVFQCLKDETAATDIARVNLPRAGSSALLSVGAAILLHVAFLKFGLSFGFVIVPVTIGAYFAFRFHIKRLEQKTREIVEASRIHLATVEALATAIDARDQGGGGHVRRTQIFSVGIGKILGLSENELNALNTGALLHDIGKLAVPDHILNKPGRLTPAELEKTKIHPSVGASILGKVPFNYPVVPTVRHHHEHFDGSGFPDGLKGQEIPLTARILAVADAYDRLRGARSYRHSVSREEARKLLINGAGTQFDPKIVDVFLRNLKKFEAAIEAEKLTYKTDSRGAGDPSNPAGDSKSYVEQIRRANREVFTLYELARIFSSSLNLEETYALFAEKIGGLVPFDTCVIYLADETGNEAKAVYAEGKNAAALRHRTIKPGEGATGYVLKKRQAVCNVNPALDFSFCKLEFVQEYSAMASLPLIADEKLLGAVSLYSCALENYEDEHVRLLETVSRIASDAILKSIYHAETETKALTDPMTGLPNARSLQIHFEKEAARAERKGTSFQLLMLDLDGFKAVNDTFGHKTGDRLLRELSKTMRAQLRDYDFLARYAGDEFVAIVPETEEMSVEELCVRLEKAVNDFVLPIGDGRFASVGISIGAASYPHGGNSLDQIVIAADKAMYGVKSLRKRVKQQEAGKNEQPRKELPSPAALAPIPIRPTAAPPKAEPETHSENFVVELDESHIVSSAIN